MGGLPSVLLDQLVPAARANADDNLVTCVGGMGVYGVRPDGAVYKITDETNRT